MRYKTIEIKRRLKDFDPNNLGFRVLGPYLDKSDRQKIKMEPNLLGIYYYYEHLPDQDAFNELRNAMVEFRLKEITRLTKEVNQLNELVLN